MKAPLAIFCAATIFALSAFTCGKETRTTVAFEATYTTTNELIDPPPALKQRITGLGKSNVLNISKFVAVSTQMVVQPAPFKLSGPCTYYADNGDVLYSTFAGTASPNPDGTITVEMTHTITGGTGKLEHASGTIVGKTIVDPKKPSATLITTGSISY